MKVYIIGFNCCGETTIYNFLKSNNIDVETKVVSNKIHEFYAKYNKDNQDTKFIFNSRDVNEWILKRVRTATNKINNFEMYVNYLNMLYSLHTKNVSDHFTDSNSLLTFKIETDTFDKIEDFLQIKLKPVDKQLMRISYVPSMYSQDTIKNIISTVQPLTYLYELSVVTIIKDEKMYLYEWITVNMKLGVQHFYIYDDESSDDPLDVLQPFIDQGSVTYHQIRRRLRRNPSIFIKGKRWIHLKRFFTDYKNDSRWVMHIDIDEFLYGVNDQPPTTLHKLNSKVNSKVNSKIKSKVNSRINNKINQKPELLHWLNHFANQNKDGIIVFPYEFGSKTDVTDVSKPCISRFKYRNKFMKNYTKMIVNPRVVDVDKLNNPHFIYLLNNNYVIANRSGDLPKIKQYCKIESPHNQTISYPVFNCKNYNQDFVIIYNHYRYKTFEEWKLKCKKYKHNKWNTFYQPKTFKKSVDVNNDVYDDKLFKKIETYYNCNKNKLNEPDKLDKS